MAKSIKDAFTNARHIINDAGATYCGGETTAYGAFPTTHQTVISLKDKQTAEWFLCPECASVFTGLPVENFNF